jgi:two-component system response regulator
MHTSGAGGQAAVLLLADADAVNRERLAASLRRGGFVVHLTGSGVETLESAEADPPDMILLDTRLPDTDGLQAIQELKTNPATAPIPILALTSPRLRHERDRCLAAGALRVLVKPIGPYELLEAVRAHLPPGPPDFTVQP